MESSQMIHRKILFLQITRERINYLMMMSIDLIQERMEQHQTTKFWMLSSSFDIRINKIDEKAQVNAFAIFKCFFLRKKKTNTNLDRFWVDDEHHDE